MRLSPQSTAVFIDRLLFRLTQHGPCDRLVGLSHGTYVTSRVLPISLDLFPGFLGALLSRLVCRALLSLRSLPYRRTYIPTPIASRRRSSNVQQSKSFEMRLGIECCTRMHLACRSCA